MTTEEEDEELRLSLRKDAANLRSASNQITESEEFKRKAALAGEVAFSILEPILSAVSKMYGGAAVAMLVDRAGDILKDQLHAKATKEI